jgi:hypothetical protein
MTDFLGDPAAIRSVAAELRRQSTLLDCAIGRLALPLEMPNNESSFADRSRNAALSIRQRAAGIGEGLLSHAAELDRAADTIETQLRQAAQGGI